ncbi:uncharacterized protein PG998_010367 [Apiospora kogelbergensis]|uniref:uncharacterized protein n=1 Tax=Apiospora kogelbergensis TaxID=1337665 RepID=UPI0031314799
MQFTTTTSAIVLATLAGFPSLAAAIGCTTRGQGIASADQWTIFDVAGVTDPDGLCNGLRDNLHHFGDCTESNYGCRMVGDRFEWQFTTPIGCNDGMVQSAWWEATRNKFGALPDCTKYI